MPGAKPLNGQAWTDRTISGAVAAALTFAGLLGYQKVNPPRPDPFRGGQADTMRRELQDNIDDLEIKLERSLEKIDKRDTALLAGQSEIWRAIANLPPPRTREQLAEIEGRIKDLEIWSAKHGNRPGAHSIRP